MEENLKEFEKDIKKEFQLERMILFSDAVFAIVITLMAIEILYLNLKNVPPRKNTFIILFIYSQPYWLMLSASSS